MKFHGRIKFTYINNDNTKKTIGSTILTVSSFPNELQPFIYKVFPDFYKDNGVRISASTVCKSGDIYDENVGKNIVRDKIEKKYYSIVKMLTDKAIEYHASKIKNINTLRYSSINRKNESIDNLLSY